MGFRGKTWEKIGRVATWPLGELFFGDKKKEGAPPALPGAPNPAIAAELARKDLMEKERKRYGRRKTILADVEGTAPIGKKTLLGA